MSLLLDALKRAEQEKLARQVQEPHGATDVTDGERPEPDGAAGRTPAPDTRTQAPRTDKDREGAKAVFAAKTPSGLPSSSRLSGTNRLVIGVGIVALLLFVAGGAYVWYEINPMSPPPARANLAPLPPRPIMPPPQAAPVPAKPADTGAPPAATVAAGAPAASASAVPSSAPRARPRPRASEGERLVNSLLRDSAAVARQAPPLRLTPTNDGPRIPTAIRQGYEALQAGDLATARANYEAALAADPTSLDGHLGLATAAAQAGDRDTAIRHFRRVLELDARNPAALAGIASLADFSRPERVETQLRADITQFPGNSALHFTLGNLYAAQARWNEAQAAFFEAYRLDPGSADLAFNLAVSLDNLGKPKLAADFYQRALAASSRQQATSFDKAQVERRIAELQP